MTEPISIHPTPGEPAVELVTRARYEAAPTYEEFAASAEANRDLWTAIHRRAVVPREYLDRVAAAGGRWHLYVLSADWCGDAVNTVPLVAKLAELAPTLDLRVVDRDANLDVMDAHLTGTSRSIPVVILLDAAFRERGWWGPRPAVLQRWVKTEGQALEKTARYREVRAWYARDRGRSTLEEVVALIERAAGRAVRPSPAETAAD